MLDIDLDLDLDLDLYLDLDLDLVRPSMALAIICCSHHFRAAVSCVTDSDTCRMAVRPMDARRPLDEKAHHGRFAAVRPL